MRSIICRIFLINLLIIMPLVAQVNMTANLLSSAEGMQIFFLSDFNISGKSSAALDIIQLNIFNNSSASANCILQVSIYSDYYPEPELAQGRTDPFTLSSFQNIIITNRNLFSKSQEFSLSDYTLAKSGNDLINRILATGKLPSGVYQFHFELLKNPYNPSDLPLAEQILSVVISNPTTLDMLSPGSNADDEKISAIYSTLPYFRWAANIDRFRLIIAEYLPSIHRDASPEEIISEKIIFESEIIVDPEMQQSEPGVLTIPSPAFQYPVYAHALQQGRIYYWRLIGQAKTSSGEIEIPGEIWRFQISNLERDPQKEMLLRLLSSMNNQEIAALFAPGGLLEGYKPTGTITNNANALSIDELIQLLTKFNSGTLQITELSVE